MSEQLFQSPIRYSGYRISLLPPERQRAAWEARLRDVEPWLPYVQQALREPFFADDYMLDMPFEDLIKNMLIGGEFFGCLHENQVTAFVILRDIKPGREAWLEGWVHPDFRGKYPCGKQMNQIIEYAFRPWNPELTPSQQQSPRGLGLRKIKASFSGQNNAAGRALLRLGFIPVGVSMMDALFKGMTTDIILVEKFNQLYLPRINANATPARQEPPPVRGRRRRGETTPSAAVRTSAGLHARAELPDEPGPDEQPVEPIHPPSPERSKHSRRGIGRTRKNANELGSVAQPAARPDGPREHVEGGEFLQADPVKSRDSADRVKPRRKRAGK